jgi:hypothetical protein
MPLNSRKIFFVAILALSVLSAWAQDPEWGPFDRVLVTKKFLDAVYPDLHHYQGLLLFRAVEFHAVTGQGNVLDLIVCQPGSGIVTYENLPPGQSPPPHCGDGRLFTQPSDFLSMDVTFGKKNPITVFGAMGSFVHSKSAGVDKQIADHPEWNDQDRLQALRSAHPRFGADQKDSLLASVPVDAIFQFTGCRLDPTRIELIAYRQETTAGSAFGSVEWRIGGRRRHERTGEEENCVARFEPFEGKLLYLGRF